MDDEQPRIHDDEVERHGSALDAPESPDNLPAARTGTGGGRRRSLVMGGAVLVCALLLGGVGLALTSQNESGRSSASDVTYRDCADVPLEPEADLHDCDLRTRDLSSADLTGANLRGSNLQGITSASINLNDADLSGADLSDASLLGVQLGGADFSGSFLDDLSIEGAAGNVVKFSGASMRRVTFDSLLISQGDFTGAKLDRASFRGATLPAAVFDGADLTAADLSGTMLAAADFSTATLTGVRSGGVEDVPIKALPPGWRYFSGYLIGPEADLSSADLHSSDLSGFDLSNANLSGSDLVGANLAGTNLSGANLEGADLVSVKSGGITGQPRALPQNFEVVGGYIIGQSVYLQSADLRGLNLKGLDLTAADLRAADLTDADLTGSDLTRSVLTSAKVEGTQLDQSVLIDVTTGGLVGTPASLPQRFKLAAGYLLGPDVVLNSAELADVKVPRVDLNKSFAFQGDFARADLTDSNLMFLGFSQMTFDGAVLNGATLGGASAFNSSFRNVKLMNSDLTGANLELNDFSDANLTGAVLRSANLGNAVLAGAVLRNADLTGADVDGATLTGADLSGARWIDGSYCGEGSIGACATVPAPAGEPGRVGRFPVSASSFDRQRRGGTVTVRQRTANSGTGDSYIGTIGNGDWVKYAGVLVDGLPGQRMVVRLASGATSTGTVEVHVDSASGPKVAEIPVSNTGGWTSWTVDSATASLSAGVHDIYLVFASAGSDDFVNVDWFKFGG